MDPVQTTHAFEGVELGALLRRLRTNAGLSRAEVAQRSGLSASTIHRWEHGTYTPWIPELLSLLDALGVADSDRDRAIGLVNRPRAARWALRAPGAIGGIPSGMLLRALRLRRGLDRASAARLIEVSPSAIGQWENGDAWPTVERLHALCHALGATAEEVAALSAGPLLPAGPMRLEEIAALFVEGVRPYLNPKADALMDLVALGAEVTVIEARNQSRAWPELLSEVRAMYAHRLGLFGRSREAVWAAERAGAVPESSQVSCASVRATIVQATAGVRLNRRRAPAMLRSLRTRLENLEPLGQEQESAYRIWLTGTAATLYATIGQAEEAFSAFWAACEPSLGRDETLPPELAWWQSRLYLALGQADIAKRLALETIGRLSKEQAAWPVHSGLWLTVGRASVELGDLDEAMAALARASAEVERNHEDCHRWKLESLSSLIAKKAGEAT